MKFILVTDSNAATSDSSPCPGVTETPITGCYSNYPKDDNGLRFLYWRCATPTISSISPNQGTAADDIFIYGTGFSETCQTSITIGGSECRITSTDDTSTVCRVSSDTEAEIALPLYVKVSVKNRGFALNLMQNDAKRHFVLLPHVARVTPNTGSVNGGCSVTIMGSGFQGGAADVSVNIGDMKCEVTEVSYTKIHCNTSRTFESSYNVSVVVNTRNLGVPATCSTGDCTFTVSETSTPIVNSIEPADITSVNQSITVNGEKFETNISHVEIYIGGVLTTVESFSDTRIIFTPGEVIVGTQPVTVKILDKGFATQTVNTVKVIPSVESVSPIQGSLLGGNLLTISGFGFKENDTTVTVGDSQCEIEEITPVRVLCRAPVGIEGSSDLVVVSNEVTYPRLQYTYSSSHTPQVSSIAQNPAKTALTISGSGFTTSGAKIHVGSSECPVTSQSDTSIECSLGQHAAGTYPVQVNIDTKGLADGTQTYTYQLEVSNISPGSGTYITFKKNLNADWFESILLRNSVLLIPSLKCRGIGITCHLERTNNYSQIYSSVLNFRKLWRWYETDNKWTKFWRYEHH